MVYVNPGLKQIVQKQLEERGARSNGVPERPVTTVKGTALFDLQFRAQVEGHSFISDERENGGGHDAGPAPLRYFLAGIMLCHKVWTIKSAALADISIDNLEGEISGYNGPPGTGMAKITYTVFVDSTASDDQIREAVDRATERCAAFATVQKATPIELTLKHNGKTIMEKTYTR